MVEAELTWVEFLVEELDYDVHGAEARAEMARACSFHGGEGVRTTHVREQRQVVACAPKLGLRDEVLLRHRLDVIHKRQPAAHVLGTRTARPIARTSGAAR